MLCQICHVKSADIKIAHVVNTKKIEINLCKGCAEQKGLDNPLVNIPQMFGNFITQLFGQDTLKTPTGSENKRCPGCGLTWRHFQKTGLFGCDACYQTYAEELGPILRKLHGSHQHIGSCPKSYRHVVDESEIEHFHLQLTEAIKRENFERAAELRDKIRDAQRKIDTRKNDGILR
jgi:protein arginine kinase activator